MNTVYSIASTDCCCTIIDFAYSMFVSRSASIAQRRSIFHLSCRDDYCGEMRKKTPKKTELILYSEDAIEVTSKKDPIVPPQDAPTQTARTYHAESSNTRSSSRSSYEHSTSYDSMASSDHRSSYSFDASAPCAMSMPNFYPLAIFRERLLGDINNLQWTCPNTFHIDDDDSYTSNYRNNNVRSNDGTRQTDSRNDSALQYSKQQSTSKVETRSQSPAKISSNNVHSNEDTRQTDSNIEFSCAINYPNHWPTTAQIIIQTQSSLSEIEPHSYSHPIKEKTIRTVDSNTNHHPMEPYSYYKPFILDSSPTANIIAKETGSNKGKLYNNGAENTLDYLPDRWDSTLKKRRTRPNLVQQASPIAGPKDQHLYNRADIQRCSIDVRDDMSKTSLFSQSKIRYSYPYLEDDDDIYGRTQSTLKF